MTAVAGRPQALRSKANIRSKRLRGRVYLSGGLHVSLTAKRPDVNRPPFGKGDSLREKSGWKINDIPPGACRHDCSRDREHRRKYTFKTHGARVRLYMGVGWSRLLPWGRFGARGGRLDGSKKTWFFQSWNTNISHYGLRLRHVPHTREGMELTGGAKPFAHARP